MGLWSKKSITLLQSEAAAEGEAVTLRRALGALNLTMLGIGAIIGAGIFVLTGTAAAQFAGPAIVLSFILAGTGCLFAGLCYAEFSAMIPIAGSAYTYGYATLGELVAWIIGWDLILEYLFGAATVAVGWSGYFVAFIKELGITLPTAWTQAPLDVVGTHTLVRNLMCVDPATSVAVAATNGVCAAGLTLTPGMLNLPAILLVGLMSTLLVIGIKESASFNNVIVFIKVAIVILVIGFGFMYVKTANWHPFIPANTGEFGHYGWSGIARGAAVVFFAYIGFDAVSTAAQEARNPQKDMPIGILASLAICTVLYILMALVMTGLARYQDLNVPHPVFVAIQAAGPALTWFDESRRTAARDIRPGPSEISDALHHDDRHRHRRGGGGGFLPNRASWRARVDRNAARVRYRLLWRHDPAVRAAQYPTPVPNAGRAARADSWHSNLRLHDVHAAERHVDPVARLDGDRSTHLLHVQRSSLEGGAPRRGRRRRRRGRLSSLPVMFETAPGLSGAVVFLYQLLVAGNW
jgi:L-asparagine transporter-like permease